MEMEELFKDKSEEQISAFAFNIGRTLDTAIRVRTNNIENENKELQAAILSFRQKLQSADSLLGEMFLKEYDEHFKIEEL